MTQRFGKAEAVDGAAGVRRLLAPNPSPMTGPGTWTYLVGMQDLAVIDPGPADPAHLAAILAAVPRKARIAAILVTHAHKDHSALAPALSQASGAPVLAFGTAAEGRSAAMQALADQGLAAGGEGVDAAFRPDRRLGDGETVTVGDHRLVVLHTPGHMSGHLCLALEEVLFTGDHVMGWAPSLISPPDGDMGAYMASLEKVAARDWRLLLPAHGPAISDPAGRIAALTAHRRERESLVLNAVRDLGSGRLDQITALAYRGLDTALMPAARRNALAHLIDLEQRNMIMALPSPGTEALWQAG